MSISAQCALAGLNRTGYYYEPVLDSEENLRFMRVLDKLYLKCPFYGSPRMTDALPGYRLEGERETGGPAVTNQGPLSARLCRQADHPVRG